MFGFTRIKKPTNLPLLGRHYHLSWWIFPKKTAAITLGSVVLHRDRYPTTDLMAHEEVHVMSNHGRTKISPEKNMIQWYASYLWETIRKGYRDNKYEKEARRLEK